MDRLTGKDSRTGLTTLVGCEGVYDSLSVSNALAVENALEKLAAYEDSGLSPEEVEALFHRSKSDNVVVPNVTLFGKPLEHWDKLNKAEAGGRLAVLPCKVGDEVYTNTSMSGWYLRANKRPYSAKVVFIGLNASEAMGGGFFNVVYSKGEYMMHFQFSDIGKTVFLTREEAEKALEVK